MPHQLDLFTRARISDPETSRQGAGHIEPKLVRLKRYLLDAFKSLGLATANEAARHALQQHADCHNSESLRKRTLDLERAGVLLRLEPRKCRVTGRSATTYVLKK